MEGTAVCVSAKFSMHSSHTTYLQTLETPLLSPLPFNSPLLNLPSITDPQLKWLHVLSKNIPESRSRREIPDTQNSSRVVLIWNNHRTVHLSPTVT
jgi:hypothetical protein